MKVTVKCKGNETKVMIRKILKLMKNPVRLRKIAQLQAHRRKEAIKKEILDL